MILKSYYPQGVLFLICLFLFLLGNNRFYSSGEIWICLSLVLFSVVLFFYTQQKTIFKGFWIKPSNILLLGLLILNFQYIVDCAIGYKQPSDLAAPEVVMYGCYVSSLGILSLFLGYYLINPQKERRSRFHIRGKINYQVLVSLQVLFFLLWILTSDVFSLLAGTQYGDGTESSPFEGLFYNTTLAILVCMAINGTSNGKTGFMDFVNFNNIVFWAIITLYIAFRLVSGDRGPAIYTSLAVFFTYLYISKVKYRLVVILGLLFAAALLLNLIGMARSEAGSAVFGERMMQSYENFVNMKTGRFSEQTILNSTEELAGSIRCNNVAIDEVLNNQAPLRHGSYLFNELIVIIPFASSWIAESTKLTPDEISSDYYITRIVFGDYTSSGQTGTTCIADFYLDFGVFGVIVGMFVMGMFFKWVDWVICVRSQVSPLAFLLVLLYASKSIYIARSTFVGQMKPFIIIMAIFMVNYLWFNNRSVRVKDKMIPQMK